MAAELTYWLAEDDGNEETIVRSEVDTLIVFEKDGCVWDQEQDITNTVWARQSVPCE